MNDVFIMKKQLTTVILPVTTVRDLKRPHVTEKTVSNEFALNSTLGEFCAWARRTFPNLPADLTVMKYISTQESFTESTHKTKTLKELGFDAVGATFVISPIKISVEHVDKRKRNYEGYSDVTLGAFCSWLKNELGVAPEDSLVLRLPKSKKTVSEVSNKNKKLRNIPVLHDTELVVHAVLKGSAGTITDPDWEACLNDPGNEHVPIVLAHGNVEYTPCCRACPNCTLICYRNESGCRHIMCPACKLKFCFVCLGSCSVTCGGACNPEGFKSVEKKCSHSNEQCENDVADPQTLANPLTYQCGK